VRSLERMGILEAVSNWLKEALLPYGGIGLMVLAVADSSFLSLPEVNDILLMTFSIERPSQMLFYAGLTTIGSVIGCAMLYSVGRNGGEALLKKRFTSKQLLPIERWYQKYGMLAVIVPSLLPPPTPFKIFVLSAGTFGISWPRFLLGVAIGRSFRYFSEGILAVLYGAAAIAFVQQNFGKIGVSISVIILAVVLVYMYSKRRHSVQ